MSIEIRLIMIGLKIYSIITVIFISKQIIGIIIKHYFMSEVTQYSVWYFKWQTIRLNII
jgi:hypothetical protein